jgi:hypothetical protein
MRFLVSFENLASANLPAEDVTVSLVLPEQLDLESVVLNGSSHPSGLHTTWDGAARRLTWFFDGIQLPPNKTPPQGEGWVEFAAVVRDDLPSGATMQMQAHIVFDENPPIDTPVLGYIVDVTPPTVSQSTATGGASGALAAFQVADNPGGSGLAGVTMYGSSNGTDWQVVAATGPLNGVPAYSGSLQLGLPTAGAWQIRAVAADRLGNQSALETAQSVPIQVTTVKSIFLPLIRR